MEPALSRGWICTLADKRDYAAWFKQTKEDFTQSNVYGDIVAGANSLLEYGLINCGERFEKARLKLVAKGTENPTMEALKLEMFDISSSALKVDQKNNEAVIRILRSCSEEVRDLLRHHDLAKDTWACLGDLFDMSSFTKIPVDAGLDLGTHNAKFDQITLALTPDSAGSILSLNRHRAVLFGEVLKWHPQAEGEGKATLAASTETQAYEVVNWLLETLIGRQCACISTI